MDLYLIHDHLPIMMELGKKGHRELQNFNFNRKPKEQKEVSHPRIPNKLAAIIKNIRGIGDLIINDNQP